MIKKVDIDGALRYGWQKLKQHLNFFLLLALFLTLIYFTEFMLNGIFDDVDGVNLFLNIMFYIVDIMINLGIVIVALEIIDNQKPDFQFMFKTLPYIINFIFASIVYTLAVFVGLILLIVPGIIIGIKYMYFPYFIIDRNAGPIESLQMSAELTDNVKWELVIFSLVLYGINIAGMLAFFIGVFITIPITAIAWAYVYRDLLHQSFPETEQINKETL